MTPDISIVLPHRGRGRHSQVAQAQYEDALLAFCAAIIQIRSTIDFDISARGWCYILENHGLLKGEFDRAQALITDCRKQGRLPLNIVAEDGARSFLNLEDLDDNDPVNCADAAINYLSQAHQFYTPISFWDGQEYYLEMLVEKIDLKGLFANVCSAFNIPIANARGWSDLNSRAAMMRRFAEHEAEGRRPVLLYCGDHDPMGLSISDFLRSNLADLSAAVGWTPENLIVDRFGLNADFIERHNLTWIDNLETSGGRRLDDRRHPDNQKPYVQRYLTRYGARKVEANALVVRPVAGRQLCRDAILKYIDADASKRYRVALSIEREKVRAEIAFRMEGANW
jgi:hypothetical protein